MRIEYDVARQLIYIWLSEAGKRAVRTEVVAPGVHVDFDREGILIGIEILDVSRVLEYKEQKES